MKKIITVVGARPQFIKASVVSKAIMETGGLSEIIIHTGQHFDANMSDVFFDQLNIPHPNYRLNINNSTHGNMTGRMLIEIEQILLNEKPDCVMVYGDTNSTLAGALAAAKVHIPVAHVEAGLRSFNMQMPEEINRVLTDRISNILFCPTDTAMENLKQEGYPFVPVKGKQQYLEKVGDVMQDSVELFASRAMAPAHFSLTRGFILVTIHRAETTDEPACLQNVLEALNDIALSTPVVLPVHPRTKKIINDLGLNTQHLKLLDPVGYLEILWLLKNCDLVVTDSGGMQKEAFFMGKACVTLREQTEWIELVELRANELAGTDKEKILKAVAGNLGRKIQDTHQLYGGGIAAIKIAEKLKKYSI